MTLKAFDSMGQEMKSGDTMLDFRGERAIFIRATRAKTRERSGKVVVKWVGSAGGECEYNDNVFDLHVVDVPEQE